MKCPDLFVGKQLFVGTYTPDPKGPIAIGVGPAAIRGGMYCAGPAVFGNATTYLGPEATLMVARNNNPDTLGLVPSIFKVSSRLQPPTPIDVVIGDLEGPVGILVNSLVANVNVNTLTTFICPKTTWVGAVSYVGFKTKVGKEIQAGFKTLFGKKSQFGAKTTAGADLTFGVKADKGKTIAPVQIAPVHVGRCTGNKKFDIPHPNKKGWRLSHVCVEGPTSDVYIRGKLDGSHIIDIPKYWQGLVDYDTITVNLTPLGRSDTSLHVKEITDEKIIISSDYLTQVKCFYQVYAERIDVEKNIPEYEGESPADYPGDVNQSSIAGYHYDVRED
jgi:hypothetical protein